MLSTRALICRLLLCSLLLPECVVAYPQEVRPSSEAELAALDRLEREGNVFELKERARAAAELEPENAAVLGYLARISDTFGDHAAEAYERWADALTHSGSPASVIKSTLERGVVVAVRDGDLERALRMSNKLEPASPYSRLSTTAKPAPSASILPIPGGTAALAQVVEIDAAIPATRFMSEYAHAILRRSNMGATSKKSFEDRLKRYFVVLQSLAAYGVPDRNETEILLDVTSPSGIDRAENILSALGWQLRRTGATGFLLEVAAGAENGERQELASALGIDEADMKLTLEAKKPFVIRIRSDRVPVILDASYWEKLGVSSEIANRGLLQDMVYDPRIAALYVALSNMNEATQRALIDVIPSEELVSRTKQLSFYGASISIEKGALLLPGGPEAAAAWAKLVEADPSQIRAFIRNLTRKDGGKLFAYYHSLAVLPLKNQRFFTRTAGRLARFYKAFPFSEERFVSMGMFMRKDDQFALLAREIPLDAGGNVRFPGSDRVWMVVTGGAENVSDVQKLLQRAGRVRTPDAEDEILLDMLDREYTDDFHRKHRAIQNFLAVVRIDAHRRQPMDETMALVLAQNYAKYESIFPLFTELTELTGPQAVSFFQAAKRLESLGADELNTALGEFHSLLKLVSLLHETRALTDAKATTLFASVCNNFGRIRGPHEIAPVAFDSLERILIEIDGASEPDIDERLAHSLTGEDKEKEFTFQGLHRSVNLAAANRRRIREVLRLQAIVPLDVILQTYRAAQKLTQGIDAQSLEQIERNLPGITEIVPSERDKLPYGFAQRILIGRPSELLALARRIRKQLEAKKPSAQTVSTLARDFIYELNPFLKTTLVGWIYANYFSPSDLAVAGNRYFVRSHVFADPVTSNYWPTTHVEQSPIGLVVVGGLPQIATAVSDIATTTVDSSESVSPYHTAAVQLGAVRSVPWSAISARSIHLGALRIRLGREFVVQSAFNGSLRELLETSTVGVLGQTRRHEFLNAVDARDFSHAFSLLTASDLFFLAEGFIGTSANKGNSASMLASYESELRIVPLQQIDYFGGIHTETGGCTHPHLMNSAPYEEYADQYLPTPLSERMSDILLEVLESADRATLPVEAVGFLAEAAIHQFFTKTRNIPREDWLSAAQAMSRIDLSTLVEVLEKR